MIAYARKIRRHTKRDEGASAVEYGLLVAAIAAVIVVIVFALGKVLTNKFDETCRGVDTGSTTGQSQTCDGTNTTTP